MPEIKLCWWCIHFNYNTGSQGYGEYTPGYDFYFQCLKHRFKDFDGCFDSLEEFRVKLMTAEKCKDYARP